MQTFSSMTAFCVCTSRYTGKDRDPETNLDNFEARYYSSAMGRSMTPDWSKNPQGIPYADFIDPHSLDLYTYVRNNPIGRADPEGHCCWDELVQTLSDTVVGGAKGLFNQVSGLATAINRPVDAALSSVGSGFQFGAAPTLAASTVGQQSAMIGVAAAAVVNPGVDLAAALSDSALVVRGGVATAAQ